MEKVRYVLAYNEDELGYSIIDTEEQFSDDIHSWDLLCDLLNQQDSKIKELESLSNVKTNTFNSIQKLKREKQQLKEQYDLLNKKYCEEMDKNIALAEQLKQQLEEKDKVIEMQKSIQRYDIGEMLVENTKLKQSQNEKAIEVLENVVKFINELAWIDVQYDADQSTMGEFSASPSAVPRYAKKYFDLWKEMFNANINNQIKELRGEDN